MSELESINLEENKSKGKVLGFFGELIQVVAISMAIIIPVRYFLIQPFYVKGASMEPNFYDGQYLIIDELSYRLGPVTRGDVVVFKYPRDPKQFFIKRVIGLPGERVKINGGAVTFFKNPSNDSGLTLNQSDFLSTDFTVGDVDITLGNSEYYLLGDNRGASSDSRSFGPVDKKFLIGRVWLRGWPLDKLNVFNSQDIPNSLK